ncbi:hypothetical protein N0V82_010302 [Gnomoniopsis sp. IMI 355080]|nr:hypothetical protein N0V82_010302 [Gnomoniopsis sp. IMI 355080]
MVLYTMIPEALQEVDVIIIGGGTAGCVVASRLAEADPGLSILLIKGGQNNNDIPTIALPVYFMAQLAPDSTVSVFHKANKSAAVGDRERHDFDAWQAHGWSAAEMLPYLKKLESFDGPDEKDVHGRSPPVQVSRGTYSATRVEAEFIESASGLDWPEVEDLSDLEAVNAVWQTQVTRILFDASHRAVGVEFRPNPLLQQGPTGDNAQQIQTIEAKRLVVYTSDHGIEDTLDELLRRQGGALADDVKARMMGWNAQDIQGKVRPAEEEIAALDPDFREPVKYPGKPCLALSAFTLYLFSRGHVYITGPRLEDPLDFESGCFVGKGEFDIKKHVWLYKKQRELIRRMPSYRGEIPPLHPPFSANSSAACVSLDAPLGIGTSNIDYTAKDDAVLEQWIRENVGTTWHSLGTCKMRPRDDMGVVDPSLNVYGVTGLRSLI